MNGGVYTMVGCQLQISTDIDVVAEWYEEMNHTLRPTARTDSYAGTASDGIKSLKRSPQPGLLCQQKRLCGSSMSRASNTGSASSWGANEQSVRGDVPSIGGQSTSAADFQNGK